MELTLIRIEKTKTATRGVMLLNGFASFCTLEPPANPLECLACVPEGTTCIPEGTYNCGPHSSAKFGNTFEVLNVPDRTEILFHAGNFPKDTHGCILIGSSFDPHGIAITGSKTALADFLAKVKGESLTLIVKS
jgi:hypothetical protein